LQERIYKEDRNHEVRSAKAVHGMQLSEAKTQQSMRLEEERVNAEIRNKERETQ